MQVDFTQNVDSTEDRRLQKKTSERYKDIILKLFADLQYALFPGQ